MWVLPMVALGMCGNVGCEKFLMHCSATREDAMGMTNFAHTDVIETIHILPTTAQFGIVAMFIMCTWNCRLNVYPDLRSQAYCKCEWSEGYNNDGPGCGLKQFLQGKSKAIPALGISRQIPIMGAMPQASTMSAPNTHHQWLQPG